MAATRLIGWYLCMTSAFGCVVGQPPSHSDVGDSYLDRRCQEILPLDGYLRVRSIDGGLVRYRCDALQALTVKEFAYLREKRDSVYVANLRSFRAARPRVVVAKEYRIMHPAFTPAGTTLNPGENVFLEADAECYQELRLFWILTRIANLATIGRQVTDSFAFKLVDPIASDDRRFMWVVGHVGADPATPMSGWTINIPRKLLWVEAMSDELLTFMILHEMGHALKLPESELNADWWAVNVGLPGFYGEERAFELRQEIAASFSAYCNFVYTQETYNRSSCTKDSVDSYPVLDCRMSGISGQDWLDGNGERIQSYSAIEGCWSTSGTLVCEGPQLRNAGWSTGTCCPVCPKCPAEPSPDNVLPDAVGLSKELQKSLVALSFIKKVNAMGMCPVRPELCEMDLTHRRLWLERSIPSFRRKARSINRSLTKGVILLRMLEQQVRGN